jgi:hypothetical protein
MMNEGDGSLSLILGVKQEMMAGRRREYYIRAFSAILYWMINRDDYFKDYAFMASW